MKLDRTLIDKDGAPSEEEAREFFLKHDYTVHKSSFDPMTASDAELRLYQKAKGFFRESWLEQLKSMGGKGSMKNFTKNYPLRVLGDANENLISGTVMGILSDDTLTAQIIDSFVSAMEEPLTAGFNAYAKSLKKEPTELSETEIKEVVDKVVNLFLEEMINIQMKSQGVPELVKTVKKNGAHEDFNNDVMNNRDKIDFDRKWYHLRTKLGAPLSLDEIVETTPEALADAEAFFKDNEKEYIILRREFLDTLNSADREIYIMLENECTQAEIAERLGYKTHSAITKREKKIKQQLKEFCRNRNK